MTSSPDFSKIFHNAEELLAPEVSVVKIKDYGIPNYVRGVLIRNGPGKFDIDDEFTMNHFFDGYAISSRFEIFESNSDIYVKFTKKYQESDAYKRAMIAKKPCVTEFGTRAYADPERNILLRHLPSLLPSFSDNGCIGIYQMGEHVFTSHENCFFRELNPDTLETGDKHDSNSHFGLALVCPHPMTDESGDIYTIGASMNIGLKYQLMKMKPEKSASKMLSHAKSIASIKCNSLIGVGYTHSFGMTKNYIIYVEQPFQTIIPKVVAASVRTEQSVLDWLDWRGTDNKKNRFYIIEKDTGKVLAGPAVHPDSPFFFWHIINCYEEEGQIVVDLLTFPHAGVVYHFNLETVRAGKNEGENIAQGKRFVIPLVSNSTLKSAQEGSDLVKHDSQKHKATAIKEGKCIIASPETLTEKGAEFPALNPSYVGKKYRYFYGSGFISSSGSYQNSLFKVDLKNRETISWKEGQFYGPSEPTFIPNPQGTDEDDGVILSTVIDSRRSEKDFVLLLDAKTMKEIGRAYFTSKIPVSFHGVYIPSQKSQEDNNEEVSSL